MIWRSPEEKGVGTIFIVLALLVVFTVILAGYPDYWASSFSNGSSSSLQAYYPQATSSPQYHAYSTDISSSSSGADNLCQDAGWECGTLRTAAGLEVNCGDCVTKYSDKAFCNLNGICVADLSCPTGSFECHFLTPPPPAAPVYCGDCPFDKTCLCDDASCLCKAKPEECNITDCGLTVVRTTNEDDRISNIVVDCGFCKQDEKCEPVDTEKKEDSDGNVTEIVLRSECMPLCASLGGQFHECGKEVGEFGHEIVCGTCPSGYLCHTDKKPFECWDECYWKEDDGTETTRCGSFRNDQGDIVNCPCSDPSKPYCLTTVEDDGEDAFRKNRCFQCLTDSHCGPNQFCMIKFDDETKYTCEDKPSSSSDSSSNTSNSSDSSSSSHESSFLSLPEHSSSSDSSSNTSNSSDSSSSSHESSFLNSMDYSPYD